MSLLLIFNSVLFFNFCLAPLAAPVCAILKQALLESILLSAARKLFKLQVSLSQVSIYLDTTTFLGRQKLLYFFERCSVRSNENTMN